MAWCAAAPQPTGSSLWSYPLKSSFGNQDLLVIGDGSTTPRSTKLLSYSNLVAVMGGVSSTSVLYAANTIYVDGENGDDALGLRGRSDRPFATIPNAFAVLEDGDTLVVRPGEYTVTAATYTSDSGSISPQLYLKDRSNIRLSGYGATLVVTNYGHTLTLEGTTNIVVEGFRFDCRSATNGMGAMGAIAAQINRRGTNRYHVFRDLHFDTAPDQCISHCYPQSARNDEWDYLINVTGNDIGVKAASSPTGLNDGSLYSSGSQNVLLQGCRTWGTNWGIIIELDNVWTSGNEAGNWIIDGCQFHGAYHYAAALHGSSTNYAHEVIVSDTSFKFAQSYYGSADLVNVGSLANITFDSCSFEGPQVSSPLTVLLKLWNHNATETTRCTNVVVSDTRFLGGSYGIYCQDSIQGLNVNGCTFMEQGYSSIQAFGVGMVFTGNNFLGCNRYAGGAAIYLFKGAANPVDPQIENVGIFGNVFSDLLGASATMRYASYLNNGGYTMTNWMVGGNVVGFLDPSTDPDHVFFGENGHGTPRNYSHVGFHARAGVQTNYMAGYSWLWDEDTGLWKTAVNSNSTTVMRIDGYDRARWSHLGYALHPSGLLGWVDSTGNYWDTYWARAASNVISTPHNLYVYGYLTNNAGAMFNNNVTFGNGQLFTQDDPFILDTPIDTGGLNLRSHGTSRDYLVFDRDDTNYNGRILIRGTNYVAGTDDNEWSAVEQQGDGLHVGGGKDRVALDGVNKLGFSTNLLGGIIAGNGTNYVEVPPGGDGEMLIADSAQPNGIRWGAFDLTSASGELSTEHISPLSADLYGNDFAAWEFWGMGFTGGGVLHGDGLGNLVIEAPSTTFTGAVYAATFYPSNIFTPPSIISAVSTTNYIIDVTNNDAHYRKINLSANAYLIITNIVDGARGSWTIWPGGTGRYISWPTAYHSSWSGDGLWGTNKVTIDWSVEGGTSQTNVTIIAAAQEY